MARYNVPGVALGVIDGDAENVAGFGVTSVEQPQLVDDETLFPVASITKTLVATVVMRLVELGLLDLEQPVRRYVPELRLRDRRSTDRLTLTHLLTHTGGFQGDVRDGAYGVRCGSGEDALARFVAMLANLPQHALPGRMWVYSNAGFSLLGRVIEAVTGKTFEAACRELVLEPLGMRRSLFSSEEAVPSGTAVGHRVSGGRVEVVRGRTLPRMLQPAGGLICPARDLLRYARFQLGDGRIASGARLLSPESMASMRAPRVGDALHNGCLASFADEVGLSWFSRATPRGRVLVHGGWSSLALRLTLVPDQRFCLFVLTNADLGAQLHAEVTKRALQDYLGIEGLDAIPIDTPPGDLASYAGTYRFVWPDVEHVEVRISGDRLMLGEWGEAAVYAPDRIVVLKGVWRHERGQFLRARSKRIAFLRMGGGLGRRLP
jgi:CubicO group peptidase (beta-lactamase class C family)